MAERRLNLILDLKDRASSQLEGVQGRLQNMKPAFEKMAAGGAVAAGSVGYLSKKALDSAGKAEEVQGRYNAVFSGVEDRTNEWVNNMSDEYGRAESTVQQMASNIGGQLGMVADNVPRDEMSKMTEELSEQSIAMAAYYPNIESADDASRALSKALSGQTDRLSEMGYDLEEGTLQQKALEEGIIGTERELSKEEEALAVHAAMMDQNSTVMDAYEENQDSYRETMRKLKEQIKEASIAIGESLMPVVKTLADRIVPVVENIAEWIEKNPRLTKNIILASGVIAGLVTVLGLLGMAVLTVTPAIGALATVLGVMASPVFIVIAAITALVAVGSYWYKNWEELTETLSSLWKNFTKKVKDIFGSIAEFFGNIWEKIKNIFWTTMERIYNNTIGRLVSLWQRSIEGARKFLGWISDVWKEIKASFGNAVKSIYNNTIGRFFEIYEGLGKILNSIKSFASKIWGGIKETISGFVGGIWESVTGTFGDIKDEVVETWNKIKEKTGDIWDGIIGKIKEWINTGIGWIEDWINRTIVGVNLLIDKLNSAAFKMSVLPGVEKTPTIGVIKWRADLPRLHNGGIIDLPANQEMPIMARGQEAIVPMNEMGGRSTIVNVTVKGDVSGQELIDKVSEGIARTFNREMRI